MKTAKEKAKGIVDGLPFAVAAHRAHLERAIALALKEQDRDTRHACAEAVMVLARKGTGPKGSGIAGQMLVSWDEGYESAIDAAHNAIMNVKAV